MRCLCRAVLAGLIPLFLLVGCSESARGGDGDSSEMFISDPRPEDIMDVTFQRSDGSSYLVPIPVSQMLVMFDESMDTGSAQQAVQELLQNHASVGMAKVGQIPPLGIYQLEIDNEHSDPEMAIAALDTVIEAVRSHPAVEVVSYNLLFELQFAENRDDNALVVGEERAALAVVDYFQAIPVFDEVLSAVSLSPVKVALIDTGIDLATGQFDDIQSAPDRFEYIDYVIKDSPPRDNHVRLHGTGVTSVIAADNGDAVTNGIALRTLGEQLSLLVCNVYQAGDSVHMGRIIWAAQAAVERGARIVNMSVAAYTPDEVPSEAMRDAQAELIRLFRTARGRDVLFIAAAPNDPDLVLYKNGAPASINEPNVLTVGGLASNAFDVVYPRTATGQGIDIAAPASSVPACCDALDVAFRYGNSYAAPLVASIAAIILSVDPSMTGADLKAFLTDPANTYPAPEAVGGVRPALLKTAGNAILQRASPSVGLTDVMDMMFGFSDDIADSTGHMINRLVGEMELAVSGPSYNRTHALGSRDLVLFRGEPENFGIIGPDYVALNLSSGAERASLIVYSELELGRSYAIPAEGGFELSAGAPNGKFVGSGVSGSITFTACELTTRSLPLDNFDRTSDLDRYVMIEMSGVVLDGQALGAVDSSPPAFDVVYSLNGSFTLAFMMWSLDEDTRMYMEQACIGGYPHAAGE